jgi:hypothetical protein
MEVSHVKVNVRQIVVYLTITFVLFAIWNSPTTTGNAVGEFLGALGSWIADVVKRGAAFLQGLSS